jgi:hypothetical protein
MTKGEPACASAWTVVSQQLDRYTRKAGQEVVR